jgi:hypothetical protein
VPKHHRKGLVLLPPARQCERQRCPNDELERGHDHVPNDQPIPAEVIKLAQDTMQELPSMHLGQQVYPETLAGQYQHHKSSRRVQSEETLFYRLSFWL